MAINKVQQSLGLTSMPFSKEITVGNLFEWGSTRDVLARLEAALENEDSALVTGPAGSGKSCIVRRFTHTLDEKRFRLLYLSAETTRPWDIAKQMLHMLGYTAPFQGSRAVRELKARISALYLDKGIKTVAILDEAQELPPATLLGLKTFLNYEMDSRTFLFLLLCGQPEIEGTLRLPLLESINRRIRIRCRVKPLSLEDTAKYIRHQMKQAGMERQIFTDEAVARIFEYSKGVADAVNFYCFNALVKTVADGHELINPAVIEDIHG